MTVILSNGESLQHETRSLSLCGLTTRLVFSDMTGTPSCARVIIIGAGIIGLSIAVSLQRAGVQVVLLETDKAGGGASCGNAGHIAIEQVFPIADPAIVRQLPRMLLDPMGPLRLDWRYLAQIMPWFLKLLANMRSARAEQIHQALLALNQQSLHAWQTFSDEWDLSQWIRIQGSLLLAENPASVAGLQQHGARLNAMGIANSWLDTNALREREPALAANQLGALFYPQTGHVTNLNAVTGHLKTAFMQMGGQLYEGCKVLQAGVQDDHTVRLHTSSGQWRAKHVVVCAGAHSRPLVRQLTGVDVPLDTERGYHLMLPNETARLSVPVSSIDRRFIMTPMQEGLRLAGTVEFAGLQAPPNMQRAQQLLQLAQPMMNAPLDDSDATSWMGFRPSIADSLPVIDRQGPVLLAFGHQHLGLTQAAVTAELIQALYFNTEPGIDIRPYRLHRFHASHQKGATQ